MAEKGISFDVLMNAEHNKALLELTKLKSFRFYMAELIGFCGTFESAFDEKGNKAAFKNGKQEVGQKIFKDIMAVSPETYLQLCKEEGERVALKDKLGVDDDGQYR